MVGKYMVAFNYWIHLPSSRVLCPLKGIKVTRVIEPPRHTWISSGPIMCQDRVTRLHFDPANAITFTVNIKDMADENDLHFILLHETL
jgi:hypothetical protein